MGEYVRGVLIQKMIGYTICGLRRSNNKRKNLAISEVANSENNKRFDRESIRKIL